MGFEKLPGCFTVMDRGIIPNEDKVGFPLLQELLKEFSHGFSGKRSHTDPVDHFALVRDRAGQIDSVAYFCRDSNRWGLADRGIGTAQMRSQRNTCLIGIDN